MNTKKTGFFVLFLSIFFLLLCACNVKQDDTSTTGIHNTATLDDTNLLPNNTDSAEITPTKTSPVEITPVETIPVEITPTEMPPSKTVPTEITPTETTPTKTTPAAAAPTEKTSSEKSASYEQTSISLEKALFIGDSRTVGLASYSNLEDADFFASIGMTVYNLWDTQVSIPNIGKVALEELLKHKNYDIIYIMLGINELGYPFEQTINHYENLVKSIQTWQPNASLILMANIHVTAARSESDPYINNPAINRFNEATSKLADNKRIFYLNANCIFDDTNGNLAKEKSSDSAHLLAKYYKTWGDWLMLETKKIFS